MSSRLPNSVCSSWFTTPAVEFLKDVPDTRLPNEMRHTCNMSAVRVIADRGALRPGSRATSANERDLVNA